MKKRTAAAFIAAMTITTLTACGGPKQLSKSVTVELGKKDGIKVTDILDVSKDKAKDVKVDTKKVNFYKEGKYDATLTYDKKEYKVTVKIKDTVAPEATAKESITVQTGAAVHVTDCLAKVTEASGNIKAEFETKPEADNAQGTETTESTEKAESTESTEKAESTEAQAISVGDVNLSSNDEITYVTAGDYDNNIVVTDNAGNETKVPVKISVINAPTINGVTDKTITVGDTIDYMAGVTATDGKGTDITSSVQVDSSAVNTSVAGTYQAAYTVVDSNGLHNSAVSNITVNAPAEESSDNSGDTDNGNAGTSDNKSNKGSSRKNKSSKKNSSSGSSSSAGSSSGSQSSSNGGGSAASQPANPKTGVAETLYDGSVAHGITAEEKSHIDGIVQKWLSGGCSGADAENEAGNYLMSRGYSISSSDSCKDALIVVPNGVKYTLNGVSYGLYYYGKMYTTGEMNGDDRIAYETTFSIS